MNISRENSFTTKLKRKAEKEPSEEEPLTQEMKIQDESESGDIEELIDEKLITWSTNFRKEIENMIKYECKQYLGNTNQEVLPSSLRFAQPSEINLLSRGNVGNNTDSKPLINTKPFKKPFQEWVDEDSS